MAWASWCWQSCRRLDSANDAFLARKTSWYLSSPSRNGPWYDRLALPMKPMWDGAIFIEAWPATRWPAQVFISKGRPWWHTLKAWYRRFAWPYGQPGIEVQRLTYFCCLSLGHCWFHDWALPTIDDYVGNDRFRSIRNTTIPHDDNAIFFK